jgi:hypothetical protein
MTENMTTLPRKFYISLICLSLVFLSACNLPSQQASVEPLEEAFHTIVAQTVIAQYTAEAVSEPSATDQIPPTNTPVPPEPTLAPTQTPSLTISPTVTQSLTKIPGAVLEDDFSDQTSWYAALEADFGFEYTDDGYRIYNNILNAAIWSVRELTYDDIRIEVDVTRKSGPDDGYFGVVCRFQDEGFNYYALVISADGSYGIIKMNAGKIEFLATGFDDAEIIHRAAGAVNRVSGTCSGEKMVLAVNGEQLLQVEDISFASGDIGMVAGNRLSGTGINVLFANFALLLP